MPPPMELRHLRYFVAVAEEENVTRAAARLHVSQPPLTRQIHDLEAEVGVAFFLRKGKSIRLTPAGRGFLEECRAVLARVDEAVRNARAVAKQQPEFHVGYAPSPSRAILRRFRKQVAATVPGARVRLHDESSPAMLAGLRRGDLHVALMMEPVPAVMRGLAFHPLLDFEVGVLVARDHPLGRRHSVNMSEVLSLSVVVFARREFPDYHAMLRRILGKNVKKLQTVEECDSGPSLIAAIEGSGATAFVPRPVAEVAGRKFRFVPLSGRPQARFGICTSTSARQAEISPLLEAARIAAAEIAPSRGAAGAG